MAELSAAVSAHDLLTTFDCHTRSCTGEAREPGGLCSYCSSRVVDPRTNSVWLPEHQGGGLTLDQIELALDDRDWPRPPVPKATWLGEDNSDG